MSAGGGSIGYTPGSLYKRHAGIGYTPGSHYRRFGSFGLMQSRNMSAMNRQAAEGANSAVLNAGPQVFEAKSEESYGLSELAGQQVLARAQETIKNITQSTSISLADIGTEESDGDDTTGTVVDESV